MTIPKYIKHWANVIWKAVGVLAIIVGLLAGYSQFFSAPSVSAQIISEVNVLDINEPLEDLQIAFQGENIQNKNLNLKIYRIELKNNGNTNITQSDFDQASDWGVEVENGKVIETRLVDSTSDYIKSKLAPKVANDNTIKFSKIILDKGSAFIVELLVLHEKAVLPTLYRIGKIAGVKSSQERVLDLDTREPLIHQFFEGSLYVNILRLVTYALLGIFLLITGLIVLMKIEEWVLKSKQKPQPLQEPNKSN